MTEPWAAVADVGGTPVLVSTEPGEVRAFQHLDKGDTSPVDQLVRDVSVAEFDGLVLPGGVANPDQLRLDEAAVAFVKEFFDAGKPVAAICHAPWILVEADVLHGRDLTSWPSLRTDISNAGGNWVDEPVKVCDGGPNTLVTSRKPDDLKAFCEALLREFDRAAA
ncbi:type 1 glutamine amidotransferase domain-containing protein [Streptomyces sp. NPDC002688]|uniref:type 1 glutamine amidotransferase domain-containing protein n=1 Tax=Streptomyces sp. NPDC002688 TaxID=3154423 RepID=UPI0033288AEC